MSGSASRGMVGLFAVRPVVLLPASAWSFWWVLVPVVRFCVARASQLTNGYVLAALWSACLSGGLPRRSQCLPMRPP